MRWRLLAALCLASARPVTEPGRKASRSFSADDLRPVLGAVLNPDSDPQEREVLRRILTRPMPPGTDYPSAAWGAATALLLLREEAPDA